MFTTRVKRGSLQNGEHAYRFPNLSHGSDLDVLPNATAADSISAWAASAAIERGPPLFPSDLCIARGCFVTHE